MSEPNENTTNESLDSNATTNAVSTSSRKVVGETSATDATGVHGRATAGTSVTYGVAGETHSDADGATGVHGEATASSGEVDGVAGVTNAPLGYGVYANNAAGGYALLADGDAETVGKHLIRGDATVLGDTTILSSLTVSDDVEVRGSRSVDEVGASVYALNSNQIPANQETTIIFDGETYDDRDEFTPSTGEFTAASAGTYHVSLQVNWIGLPDDTNFRISIEVNGTSHTDHSGTATDTANNNHVEPTLSRTLRLNAGDTVSVVAWQDSASSRTIASGERSTWMTVDRLG